ncbi:MAG: hypothetical protein BMS9Abin20_1077 [Acidimicrobiia bacterium]|nr:MAG: hypothetical protein BMS9Abin20_1077 [Acidimicrobiia bacterium]
MTSRSHDAEVLLFSSPHCPTCSAMRPMANDIAASFDGAVHFRELDTTADRETVARYRVKGVPTLVAVHRSTEVGRFVGARSRGEITKIFETARSGTRTRGTISSTDRTLRLAVAGAFAVAAFAASIPVLWIFAIAAATFALSDLVRS